MSVEPFQRPGSPAHPVPPAPKRDQKAPALSVERHIVLRNGNESIVGALCISSFATAIEAAAEAEAQHRKYPSFFFWHTAVSYRVVETTNIESRRLGPDVVR